MDDPNNNEEFDASQAMQKARKQAQAQARAHAKDGNKKENSTKKNGGAILHVNNYRNGVPEAKCKMSKNPNFPTSLKPGYVVRSKGAVESSFIVEAKLAARVYMVRNQKTEKFCALKIEPYYNEGDGAVESSFIVEAKLAARVYMVRNQKTEKFCALKIEPYYNEGDVKQLKRDVFILMEAMKLDQRFNVHFPKIISKGRVPDHFKYVITALCDFNLDDLREKVIKNDFSLQTAARLSMQAFQALHDMHTLGYLHRNIAPSKFMLGLENSTLIYLGG
uniref:Protein kinase domain-containing protein n=1 Tax=Panagrolaimus sp. ES5 TaxID=591445 RepID=A0AC34G6W7_9BILA